MESSRVEDYKRMPSVNEYLKGAIQQRTRLIGGCMAARSSPVNQLFYFLSYMYFLFIHLFFVLFVPFC